MVGTSNAYILDDIQKPTKKILTSEMFSKIKQKYDPKKDWTETIDNFSNRAAQNSPDRRTDRNVSFDSRKSHSPKRDKSFIVATSVRPSHGFKKPEEIKAESSKFGWKCVLLSKEIKLANEFLEELKSKFSQTNMSKLGKFQGIIQEFNRIRPRIEKLLENFNMSESQRSQLQKEFEFLSQNISRYQKETVNIKSKFDSLESTREGIRAELTKLSNCKNSQSFEIEELQFKIGYLNKDLLFLKEKSVKEDRFLTNSKRRVDQARSDIESLRSKSVAGMSKSKAWVSQSEVQMTPKLKTSRSTSQSHIDKVFDRLSKTCR